MTKPPAPLSGGKRFISVMPYTTKLFINGEDIAIVIRLTKYEVINQTFKFYLDIISELNGKVISQLEGGMGGIYLSPSVSIRPYSPIELHQSDKGYVPKMVYSIPRNCRVESYVKKEEESFLNKARKHTVRSS